MPRKLKSPARVTSIWQGSNEIANQIKVLEKKIDELKERVSDLEARAKEEDEGEAIVLRDVPRDQAKGEIKALFSTGLTLYMSEVADRLRLPSPLVVDICRELRSEGELIRGNAS